MATARAPRSQSTSAGVDEKGRPQHDGASARRKTQPAERSSDTPTASWNAKVGGERPQQVISPTLVTAQARSEATSNATTSWARTVVFASAFQHARSPPSR